MMSGGDTRGEEKSASVVERGVSEESSSHGRIGDLGF